MVKGFECAFYIILFLWQSNTHKLTANYLFESRDLDYVGSKIILIFCCLQNEGQDGIEPKKIQKLLSRSIQERPKCFASHENG